MEFLAWLEQTDASVWLRESDWGHPIILCFHAVGMGMVVGISLMYSARLFGLAWFGFAMNAASGVVLFFGEPRRLMDTPAFWIKMILIMFAGLALRALGKALHGDSQGAIGLATPRGLMVGEAVASPNARIAAIFSVAFWLGAIVSGRLIGYTMPPPPL